MPEFTYRAVSRTGQDVTGSLLAESEDALEASLLGSGYWLVDCE